MAYSTQGNEDCETFIFENNSLINDEIFDYNSMKIKSILLFDEENLRDYLEYQDAYRLNNQIVEVDFNDYEKAASFLSDFIESKGNCHSCGIFLNSNGLFGVFVGHGE